MRSLQGAAHFTNSSVQIKLSESIITSSHTRWQIIYLIQICNTHSAELIDPVVNLSLHSIYKIVERYKIEGADALVYKKRRKATIFIFA